MMLKRLIAKSSGVLFYMVQYGCAAYCFLEYGATCVKCTGPSMQPTIFSNDVLLIEHISVNTNSVQKGDVVTARSPTKPSDFICKRVVGMEGDSIFVSSSDSFKCVPKGHVWLEGDNKNNSTDSRHYGPVPYALLRGKVFVKVWPLHSIGALR